MVSNNEAERKQCHACARGYSYTKDDFITTVPYELLYELRKTDPFEHAIALASIRDNAKAVGFTGFNTIYSAYIKKMQSSR